MKKRNDTITRLILQAAVKAQRETGGEPESQTPARVKWPISCTVGPGLEGAIACETRIGYVNGSKGELIYRGYSIFDLCAHSNFEEVCYLLHYGRMPSHEELYQFRSRLIEARYQTNTLRRILSVPVEEMHPMAALRLGVNFLRQRVTWREDEPGRPDLTSPIASDEDSIPMETAPRGEERAIYEFPSKKMEYAADGALGITACFQLISGMATIAAAIARLRKGLIPIEPDPDLGHAANFLYMMTGRRPTPEEERIMDVALILHADHGMNASTFASMVVASTMADMYYSVASGVSALSGPLHGGANELVIYTLREIGAPENVTAWFERARQEKRRVMGFGHRVYKAYDPRARVLAPLAGYLARKNREIRPLYKTARALEDMVVKTLGKDKKVFPNVDFYSGLVYSGMGIPPEMFTPIFAVSRVAGWTSRVMEYMEMNRIFRPRAWYVGTFGEKYVPIAQRAPAH